MGECASVLPECAEGRDYSLESSLIELAGYRMERAKEMFSAAEGNLEIGQEYCVQGVLNVI